MAQNITTLNEIRDNNPQGATPALTDLLYMLHGTGGDRDRAYTLEEVRDLLQAVFTRIVLTKDSVTTTVDGTGVTLSFSAEGFDFSVALSKDGLEVSKTTQGGITSFSLSASQLSSLVSGVGGVKIAGQTISFMAPDGTTVLAQLSYDSECVKSSVGFMVGSCWRIRQGDYGTLVIDVLNGNNEWEHAASFAYNGNITSFRNLLIPSDKYLVAKKINGIAEDSSNPQTLELVGDINITKGQNTNGNLNVAGKVVANGKEINSYGESIPQGGAYFKISTDGLVINNGHGQYGTPTIDISVENGHFKVTGLTKIGNGLSIDGPLSLGKGTGKSYLSLGEDTDISNLNYPDGTMLVVVNTNADPITITFRDGDTVRLYPNHFTMFFKSISNYWSAIQV